MFEVITTQGNARRGHFTCAHGTAETPVFMNVGTQGAIKGALDAGDLKNIRCQIELSNTYHLHLRPGDKLIHELGRPHPDGQRRVPGLLPGKAPEHQGGGGHLPEPRGRPQDFYGAGGVYDHPGQSRF